MDNIIWDDEKKDSKSQNEFHPNFYENKRLAEKVCARMNESKPKAMRFLAKSNYLEIGITFPIEHHRSNLFADVPYNNDTFEFSRIANYYFKYFHGLSKQIITKEKFDHVGKCELQAKLGDDGKMRCPCGFVMEEKQKVHLNDIPWWKKD